MDGLFEFAVEGSGSLKAHECDCTVQHSVALNKSLVGVYAVAIHVLKCSDGCDWDRCM